jgi:NAD+ diphosphatase
MVTGPEFRLRNIPLLSRVGADRSDHLRTDIDAAIAGWADAAVLRVDPRGQVLIADGQVVFNNTADLGERPPPTPCSWHRRGGRHVWAIRAALLAGRDRLPGARSAPGRNGFRRF